MAKVKVFSANGDDTLLEYDPQTANMDEVNAFVDNLERKSGGRAFAEATGNAVEKIDRETGDVLLIRPISGG